MRLIWPRLRPHVLGWHMLPCLVMLIAAVWVAISTGRPASVIGALGCMVMMMATMSAMGGHQHRGPSDDEHKR